MQRVQHDRPGPVQATVLPPASIDVQEGLMTFLRNQPEKTLLLVAQDLTHSRVSEVAASAKQAAGAYGYQIVPMDFHRSPLRERALLHAIREAYSGGVIFLWDYCHDNLDLYSQIVGKQPCIQVLDPKPIPDIDFIGVDEYSGGSLATRHLINLGHRRVGHITLDYAMRSVVERRQAYMDMLVQNNLPLRDEWQLALPYGLTESDRITRLPLILQFLSQQPRPDALFICSDWLALEVVECAQEMGLRIPQDLAIVGYDDALPYCLARIPLTTIHADAEQLGRLAVERLVLHLHDGASVKPCNILLPPLLVIRESSAYVTATTERWAAAMRYIQEHFRNDISAREVAATLGLDAHYFSQQFRQAFGMRFTDYLHYLRLQYAARLLVSTEETVEHSANAAGFQSMNHFYTLFKRTYHLSPHAYRKRHTPDQNNIL